MVGGQKGGQRMGGKTYRNIRPIDNTQSNSQNVEEVQHPSPQIVRQTMASSRQDRQDVPNSLAHASVAVDATPMHTCVVSNNDVTINPLNSSPPTSIPSSGN